MKKKLIIGLLALSIFSAKKVNAEYYITPRFEVKTETKKEIKTENLNISIKSDFNIEGNLKFELSDPERENISYITTSGSKIKLNNVRVGKEYILKLLKNDKYMMKDFRFIIQEDLHNDIGYVDTVVITYKNKYSLTVELKKKSDAVTPSEKPTEKPGEQTKPLETIKKGWNYNNAEKYWYYVNERGNLVGGWMYDNAYSSWFLFDKNGKMQTGWVYDNAYKGWFYFRTSGKMEKGWMYDNSYKSWFYFGTNGKMQTGWIYDKKWYFLGSNGALQEDNLSFENWYVENGYFNKTDKSRRYKVNNDFIVVSLKDQKLYLVKDKKLVRSFDIISGKPSTPTVTGNYKIFHKGGKRYLVGADYKVWVERWLPFFKGYGIHDARWQRDYHFKDKKAYTYRGSHGCVNVNKKEIDIIYNTVYVGYQVIVID